MLLAVFILLAVWWTWEKLLGFMLRTDSKGEGQGWDEDVYKRVILILGAILLVADACLFYSALNQMGWGSSQFSVSSLLATAAYVTVVLFVSLISLKLRRPIEAFRASENKP